MRTAIEAGEPGRRARDGRAASRKRLHSARELDPRAVNRGGGRACAGFAAWAADGGRWIRGR
jgi:hypothetical protein